MGTVRQTSVTLAIACGGIFLALSLGERHGFGLFLYPITMDLGWSREAFAFALALQNLVWGIAQPFTGMLADKYGSPRVLAGGALAYGAGLGLMPYSSDPAAFTLSAGFLVGLGLSGTAFGIVYGAIGRIAPERSRGAALGVSGALGSFGQFVMLPVNQQLISRFGWEVALLAAGALMAAALPLSRFLADRASVSPLSSGPNPASNLRTAVSQAFAHWGFLMLGSGFFVCGFQLAFIATHLPAYLLDRGLSAATGATALAIIGLTNVLGTYVCGLLGDRLRKKNVLGLMYMIRSAAILLFLVAPVTPLSVYAFSAVMGLLWLGTVPLTSGLVAQIFGVRFISTLFGFVFFVHQLGSFFGVWLGGRLFDATGSYDLVWTLAIAVGGLAAILHYPIDDRPVKPLSLSLDTRPAG